MTRKITTLSIGCLAIAAGIILTPRPAFSHCQVPCGIYDDHARVSSMLEDAATVSKAVAQINELASKTDALSRNQFARWVMNKESHAQSVIETISHYFLTQRVKASQDDYAERLQKHHAIIVAAMKTKQTADPADAEALVAAIKAIADYYPEKSE